MQVVTVQFLLVLPPICLVALVVVAEILVTKYKPQVLVVNSQEKCKIGRSKMVLAEIANGDAYRLLTYETSRARMFVINHEVRKAWVNLTLQYCECNTCEHWVTLADEQGRTILEHDNYLWVEVEYPKDGELRSVEKCDVFFTLKQFG